MLPPCFVNAVQKLCLISQNYLIVNIKLTPMQHPVLHIINLPYRSDRKECILDELKKQEITTFRFWEGIINIQYRAAGIAQAHKQIVQYAKNEHLPFITIAEDDIRFTASGAFEYYCANRPDEYDLYLGAVSYGKISDDNKVEDFSGLLLYTIHARFYDTFLSIPEQGHIDRCLKHKGLYKVCPLFVVIEENGYSDNSGRDEDNSIYYADRPLYGRSPAAIV